MMYLGSPAVVPVLCTAGASLAPVQERPLTPPSHCPPVGTIQNVCRHCQVYPEGQNHPRLRACPGTVPGMWGYLLNTRRCACCGVPLCGMRVNQYQLVVGLDAAVDPVEPGRGRAWTLGCWASTFVLLGDGCIIAAVGSISEHLPHGLCGVSPTLQHRTLLWSV